MKNTLLISLLFFLTIQQKNVNAQIASCGASVPYFYVDMTGTPDSTWVSPNISRNGQCCGAPNNENCISFELVLDSNSAGIQIDMIGADPSGSLFYDIGCAGNYPGGTLKCISGVGPHEITFCKPGGNKNIFIIKSIPKPTFPSSDSVRVGCNKDLKVYGLTEASVKWNSVFPGTQGQYNSYLSCISCSNPNYNSDTAAPPYIDYEICGTPIASLCGYVGTTCDTVRVYNFDPLNASFNPDSARFCDLGPGSGVTVTATASGGDGNYTYQWFDSANNVLGTGNSIFATYQGYYSLALSDGLTKGNCPPEVFPFYVEKGDLPVVDAGTYDKVCARNPNVVLQGTITNAGAGYWSNGTGTFSPDSNSLIASYTPSAAEVSAGFVKLYLTSVSNGCPSVTDSTIITIADSVKVTIADTTLACNNDVVTLTSSITGGTAPYAHFWSNGAITNSINVGAGTYSVFITDSLGCTVSAAGTVTTPAAISTSISSTDATTNGGSDGTATVTPSGGTPGYTYLWSPSGATSNFATGLSYGIHTVAITDSKGCTANASVVVNEPRCSSFSSTTNQSDNICFGDTLGEAVVNPSGGTAPYSYSWSNGDTTMVSSYLAAGTYTVTVTDFNGCIDIQTVTITEPSRLNNIITKTDATTIGGNQGTALANPSGGSPGYSYSWSNGDNTIDADSLTAGVYILNLSDLNGCTRIDSVRINEPPCDNFLIGINKIDILCNGGSDGEAEVFVLNGVAPYTINWSNGQTSARDTNLVAGTYTVNLTDSRGCSNFGNIDIYQPAALSLGLAKTDISCFGEDDGTIDASISGGKLPYSYEWSNLKYTQDLASLDTGKYVLTVTDANNCIVKDSASIIEPLSLGTSYVTTDISCHQGTDGAIDLTVTGGVLPYTYNWSNGATSQDISGVVSGGYSVTVSDGNNCVLSTPLVIGLNEPDSVEIDSSFVHCPTPGNDSTLVELFPIGGNGGPYQISFDNGATYGVLGTYNFNLKTDTTYVIIARDTNLCISPTPDTVTINPNVVIDSINFSACGAINDSNTINVYPNGGIGGNYQVSTDNGATFNPYGVYTLKLLANTGYNIIVRDSLGCISLTDSIYIADSLTVNTTILSDYNGYGISCFGLSDGSISSTVTGGQGTFNYSWSNGSNNDSLINVVAGTYKLIVTDGSGCIDSSEVTLTQPTDLVKSTAILSDYNGTDISCFGLSDGLAQVTSSGGNGGHTYSWSNATSNDSLINVPAGKYYVTITDSNGCSTIDSVTLTQPTDLVKSTAILSDYNGTDISCFGLSDGLAQVTSSGGNGGHIYSWSNATSNDSLINVPAGKYYVTITDSNGCSTMDSVTLTQPTDLVKSTAILSDYNGTDISCFGLSDGLAQVTSSGGNGGHTYSWSNATSNDSLINVPAGKYYVTITDSNGCSTMDSVTLTQPTDLVKSTAILSDYNGTDISCFGLSDGLAKVTSSGGNGGHTYSWSNATSNDSLINVPAGKYYVTITDSNGCSTMDSVTLTQPTDLVKSTAILSDYNGTDISCFGLSDGLAQVTSSGGNGGHTYSWSNATSNDSLINVPAGKYYVTITDSNGCSTMDSVTLTQPTDLVKSTAILSDYNGTDISCFGLNDGLAQVTSSGGNGGHTYSWSNATSNDSLINVPAGKYYVTITDSNGCSTMDSVTLTQPTDLVKSTAILSDYNGTDISCFGLSDGLAQVTSSGGNGGHTYSWSNATSNDSLINVPAGKYYVTITDSNGCNTMDSVTLTQPTDLVKSTAILSDYNGTDISCFGLSDGLAQVTSSGGNGGHTYSWSNATSNDSLINVPAGKYYVTITDSNGCSTMDSVTLTQPTDLVKSTAILSDYNGTDISCFGLSDGLAQVTSSGGNGGHTYSWSNATSNDSLINVPAGKYYVTITDSNGCNTMDSVTLTQPTDLVKSTAILSDYNGTDISCFGLSDGLAQVTSSGGNGGHTYSWSNATSNDSLINVTAGKYYVTITDSNGCSTMDSVTLTQPTDLVKSTAILSDYNGTDISCFGLSDGLAQVTSSGGNGGHIYSWSNATSNDSLINVPAGKYYVTITDSNGCSTMDSVTLTQPTDLVKSTAILSDYNGTDISCFGLSDGLAQVTSSGGNGGHTYSWSNATSNDSLINVPAGTYYVTITDSNGCSTMDSVTLTQPSAIAKVTSVISNYNEQDISCYGLSDGLAVVNSSGGNGGHTYSWSNATSNDSLINVPAGTYYVTITDSNGCFTTDSITLNQPTDIVKSTAVLSNYNGTDISCYGLSDGLAVVNSSGGNGGHTYSWSNATFNDSLMNVPAGTYYVTITDSNGCFTTDSVTLTQPDSIAISFTSTNVSCNGGNDGSIDLSFTGGTPGFTYLWNGPGQFTSTNEDLLNIAAGIYTVIITDTNDCFKQKTDIIVDPSAIALDFIDFQNVKCYNGSDGSIDLDVTGGTPGYTYSWTSNNNFTFADSTLQDQSNLPEGTYTVVVTDNNSCFTSIVGVITHPDSITVSAVLNDVLCYGAQNGNISIVPVGGTTPYSYLWNNGDTLASINSLDTGIYTVTVIDSNNCSVTESYTVAQPDSLNLTLFSPVLSNGFNISYYQGEDGEIDATVIGGSVPYSYVWSNGETVSDLFNLKEGKYILTVTDNNNCVITDSIQIYAPLELEMPTGFTPNADGSNDLFVIRGIEAYPNNHLSVFNRWGDLVYEKDNYSNTWDGIGKSNNRLPDATYFAILKIKDTDIILKGYVDLRR